MAKKGNILVIDDEEIMRDVLESLLSQEGHRVDLAKTGEEGLQRLHERAYDVILLDVSMPGMGGLRSLEEILKLDAIGVRGVRFNFVRHLGGVPDMDELHRVLGHIAPLGWHVDLHFDAQDLPQYDAMLSALPVPFIIDHMGRVPTSQGLQQAPFQVLLALHRRNRNCWVKISGAERIASEGPPFTSAVPFAQALIEAGADRILWGTDWPHPNIARHMPNDGDLVDLLPLMMPDEATRQRVLVDNPHRLYQFTA